MDRRRFLDHMALGGAGLPASAAFPVPGGPMAEGGKILSDLGFLPEGVGAEAAGVRRLSAEKFLTIFHAKVTPAYNVTPGEVVQVECRHGLPGLVTREGQFTEPGPKDPINPATGPIAIDGVEAGDGLAIDILEIRTADWGYCNRHIFELKAGYVHLDQHLRLPMQPMIGVIGIAPAQGTMDTRIPADTGGNMDCREVRAGSTLLFTAQVSGALVGIGDPHALQGDGEICGQGIETDAEVLVRFRKLKKPLGPRPVILRPEYVATLAAHKDLTEAAWQATGDMVKLLSELTGLEEKVSRWAVNLLGLLRINQIVDTARGARMEMPSWIFGLRRGAAPDD